MNRYQRRGQPQSGTWTALLIYPFLVTTIVALLVFLVRLLGRA